ncbi:MAG: NADH-quinone oxidoreductase subunit NuoH [Candidatus Electryoneaceae bacterium]|nr:NADH-quinone oxidoreductase subunit NuoH [Candidatus Electryoneaceae bacterium]
MSPELLHFLITVVFVIGIIGFVSVFALVAIWFERKVSAHIQDRLGPMETGGWHGWSQTIADTIKLLVKEDIIPDAADKPLFRFAPYVVFGGTLATFVVFPFAANLIGSDLNVGVYYLVAVSSLVVIGLLMAGWSSNNKWALYGAMRSAGQMISYEIPVALSLLVPVMLVGSLSMQDLVAAQTGGFWNWTIFSHLPFALLAFVIYYWASLAEVNRCPFDLPEGESEIVAGYNVEYSGMRFAMFFLAEFANMFVVSAVATAAFLGGWSAPLPFLEVSVEASPILHAVIGTGWFVLKAMLLVLSQMWLRWTLPRLRVDQLMHVCWKIFLPFSFANVLLLSLWIALAGN